MICAAELFAPAWKNGFVTAADLCYTELTT